MNRPTYETEGTKSNEAGVISDISKRWNCEAFKLPKKYIVDYALFRDGSLRCFVEVKCRNNDMNKYPDYSVALSKFMEMISLSKEANVPSFLVVRWNDKLCFHAPEDINNYPIRMGGRKDRGDWQDQEPMVHVSLDNFTEIQL